MNKLIPLLCLVLLALPAGAQESACCPSEHANGLQTSSNSFDSSCRNLKEFNVVGSESIPALTSIPSVEEFILDIDHDATLDDACSLRPAVAKESRRDTLGDACSLKPAPEGTENHHSVGVMKKDFFNRINTTVSNVVALGLATGLSLCDSIDDLTAALQKGVQPKP